MKDQGTPTLYRLKIAKIRFCFKKRALDTVSEKGHLGNSFCRIPFSILTSPGTQKFCNQWKDARLLLLLVANLGISHVVQVLHTCRIQELWGTEEFSEDFRSYQTVWICKAI